MATTSRPYTACENNLDGPYVSCLCERPRGHAGNHRKTLGGATVTWQNTARSDDRSVVVNLPLMSHHGSVFIGGHEVSSTVSGVSVDADVHSATEITLRLKPGSLDIDAEGHGKFTEGAHQLLTLLGWTPPDEAAPPPVEAIEQAAEWRRLDEWRLGVERVVCLDPSCPCDPDETSILVDDVTELSAADIRQMISNHRNAQTEPS